jgi:hypothetical protein
VLLVTQRCEERGVIVLWVGLLLAGQKYSVRQVRKSTENLSAMQYSMTTKAEPKIIPDVMLAPSASDEVMDIQLSSAIGLRPPTDSTTAMLLDPEEECVSFRFVHRESIQMCAGTNPLIV